MNRSIVWAIWAVAIIVLGALLYVALSPKPESLSRASSSASEEVYAPLEEFSSEDADGATRENAEGVNDETPAAISELSLSTDSSITGRVYNEATGEGIEGISVTAKPDDGSLENHGKPLSEEQSEGDEEEDESEGAVVEGVVTYNGSPVANQRVVLSASQNQESVTDSQGLYRFTEVKPGKMYLEAHLRLEGISDSKINQRFNFDIKEDGHIQQDFNFNSFDTVIYGHIIYEDDIPSDANITILSGLGRNEESGSSQVVCDKQGIFTVEGLPAGKSRVTVRLNNLFKNVNFYLYEGQPFVLEIDMTKLVRVSGTIQGPENMHSPSLKSFIGERSLAQIKNLQHLERIKPNNSGQYTLTLPKAGTYTIVATMSVGNDPSVAPSSVIQVITVEDKEIVVLDFEF